MITSFCRFKKRLALQSPTLLYSTHTAILESFRRVEVKMKHASFDKLPTSYTAKLNDANMHDDGNISGLFFYATLQKVDLLSYMPK